MKQRTIKILIIISMAFNLAFIGNFVYHRIRMKNHPGPMMEQPPPPPNFRNRLNKVMDNVRPEREEFMEASRTFFELLTNPEFDVEKAEAQLDSMIAKQMKMEKKIGNGIILFHSELSEEDLKTARKFFDKRRDNFKKRRFDRPKDKMNEGKEKRREK